MKRNRSKKITLVLVALALLFVSVPAWLLAQPPGENFGKQRFGERGPGERGPGMRGPGERGAMMGRLADALDLSEAQRGQIRDLFVGQRDEMEARLLQLESAHQALQAQIHAVEFDEAAIRDAAGTLAAIKEDMAVERAKKAQEVRQVLTPEQQEKADLLHDMRQDRLGRRGSRFGPHNPFFED